MDQQSIDNGELEERRCVTLDLIRKRSEHHEGLLSDLKELDFHQDHLEAIGPLLGRTCPNLTHLYLHNNLIDNIEIRDWRRFQHLKRLSLALNNLTVLEHLGDCCPRLQHLDASFNFISLDNLQASLECLQPLKQLKDLFLQGNLCERQWKSGIGKYVMAQLPSIQRLDGMEVRKEDREEAERQLTLLQQELQLLVERGGPDDAVVVGPKVRAAMSREWLTLPRQPQQEQPRHVDPGDEKKPIAAHGSSFRGDAHSGTGRGRRETELQ